MDSIQPVGSACDFDRDLSMRWLCRSLSFVAGSDRAPDTSSSEPDFCSSDFEFATPALPESATQSDIPILAAEDLFQDGIILPALPPPTASPEEIPKFSDPKIRRTQIAEHSSINLRNSDQNSAESSSSKKCRKWKQMMPKFLHRSSSASKAEKPVSKVLDPWLGRSGSDSRTILNSEARKSGRSNRVADSMSVKGLNENRSSRSSPARYMDSPKFSPQRLIALPPLFLLEKKFYNSRLQAGTRRQDLQQRCSKKPTHFTLHIPQLLHLCG